VAERFANWATGEKDWAIELLSPDRFC